MSLFNLKFVICALVAALALSVSAERALQQDTIDDLGSQISAQVNAEIAKAQKEMLEKCGPDAGSISNDMCYGTCSGSQTIDNSKCTCNGNPCVSWKVGETGPSMAQGTPTATTSDASQSSGMVQTGHAAGVGAVFVSAAVACIMALFL